MGKKSKEKSNELVFLVADDTHVETRGKEEYEKLLESMSQEERKELERKEKEISDRFDSRIKEQLMRQKKKTVG